MTAKSAGSRLLTNVNLQTYLASLRATQDVAVTLALAEKRAFLRSVVLTPIGEVDGESELCQSWSCRRVLGRGKPGHGSGEPEALNSCEIISIKIPDKLKAIELDARLAGELQGPEVKPDHDNELRDLLASIRSGQ
jgi:hypothetical protein